MIELRLFIPESIMYKDGRRDSRKHRGVQFAEKEIRVGEIGLDLSQISSLMRNDDFFERRVVADIPCLVHK